MSPRLERFLSVSLFTPGEKTPHYAEDSQPKVCRGKQRTPLQSLRGLLILACVARVDAVADSQGINKVPRCPVIHFRCPHCQTMLSGTPEHIGQQAKCGKCGQVATVPKPPTAIFLPTVPMTKPSSAKLLRTPLRLCLFVGAMLLFLVLVGGIGFWLSGSKSHCVYERAELERTLSLATPDQVRAKLGSPDFLGNVPQVAPGNAIWIYEKRTRNPATGEIDQQLAIWFEAGVVSDVVCDAPTKIRRP
jgi:hypothetical protein